MSTSKIVKCKYCRVLWNSNRRSNLSLSLLVKISLSISVFFACIAISSCVANEYMDPEWIDPHAWSRDDNPLAQLCPQSQPCKPCEQTAQAPYLRLVNSLFNPSEFRVSVFLRLFCLEISHNFVFIHSFFFCSVRWFNKLFLSCRAHSRNWRAAKKDYRI